MQISLSITAVLGKMKIGLSNSTTINDQTPYCYHLTGTIPNGESRTYSCTGNNVGRYFYLYRDNDGYNKDVVNVCEVILEGYPTIGNFVINNLQSVHLFIALSVTVL